MCETHMNEPKEWRCFFCDEVFTTYAGALEHFGRDEACDPDVPACKLATYEGHLVHYIRKLEDELRRYQSEDSDVMRSIMALEADHKQALIKEEEIGYNRGVRDAQMERAINMNKNEELPQFDEMLRCTNPVCMSMGAGITTGHGVFGGGGIGPYTMCEECGLLLSKSHDPAATEALNAAIDKA